MLFTVLELALTMATGNSQSSSSEIELKDLIRCTVKGYQECLFKVKTGNIFRIFTAVKKIGGYGRAFKVVDAARGQLGHLQREFVSVLWSVTSELTW